MILDMASAAAALALLIVAWLTPVALFLLTSRMRGTEKYNWAILITVLTWPGYALFLYLTSRGGSDRHH